MRITMKNGIEIEPFKISWARIAMICFAAGGLYALVQSNTDDIKTLRTDLSGALVSQSRSNLELSESITDLNGTLIRLEESLRNRENDVESLKESVTRHDREISEIRGELHAIPKPLP